MCVRACMRACVCVFVCLYVVCQLLLCHMSTGDEDHTSTTADEDTHTDPNASPGECSTHH